MTIKRKKHPYYKFDKVMSYNAVINMVAGGRGIGKTYGAIKMGIDHWIERQQEFIYLRRYRPETVAAKNSFFAAVGGEFPDWDMRVNGNNMEAAHVSTREDNKREWSVMGYFVTLSQAQSYKGVPYPDVTKIIFDEFILEKSGSRYLSDEAKAFINFYSTVDRYQDKTIVLMLANAVGIDNPYFIEWEIEPEKADKNGILTKGDGFIAVHLPDSDDFKESIYRTRLGKFIQDSEYAEYAVENKFADNKMTLVEDKDPYAKYVFSLTTAKGTFSVWHNAITGEAYAQRKLPKAQHRFTTEPGLVDRNIKLMRYTDPKPSVLRTAFRNGQMTFDHPRTRIAFMEVFKR